MTPEHTKIANKQKANELSQVIAIGFFKNEDNEGNFQILAIFSNLENTVEQSEFTRLWSNYLTSLNRKIPNCVALERIESQTTINLET